MIHPVVVAHHSNLTTVYLGDRSTIERARGMDIDMPVNTDHGPNEACNETEIVGHQDDREVTVELLQQLEEVLLHLLIEAGGGFVQEQELRVGYEGAGEQDALPLSTREV